MIKTFSLFGQEITVYDGLELKGRKVAQFDALFKTWRQVNPVAQEADMAYLLFAEMSGSDGFYGCNPDPMSRGYLPIRELAAWVHVDGHMTWVPTASSSHGSRAGSMLLDIFQTYVLARGEPIKWSPRGSSPTRKVHHAVYDV